MTAEQKRQLELLKELAELEELENKEVEAEVINEEEFSCEVLEGDFSLYEEVEEIQTNIIFEEDYRIKVKRGGIYRFIDVSVTMSDIDALLINDIRKEFETLSAENVNLKAVDAFLNDCIVLTNAQTGMAYAVDTTKEKFMIVTTIMKKITPSLHAKANRQQRRAAQRGNKNK